MFIMSFMIKASMTPLVPPPSKDKISNPPSLISSLSVTIPRKKNPNKKLGKTHSIQKALLEIATLCNDWQICQTGIMSKLNLLIHAYF